MKWWTHGVSLKCYPRDLSSSFTKYRIIHCYHQRRIRWQIGKYLSPDNRKQFLDITSLLTKEPIVRCPVIKLLTARHNQPRNSTPSQTDQCIQRKRFPLVPGARLGEGFACFLPEALEGIEEARRRFFLSTDVGGAVRRRTSCARSSMSHSTTSPRSNLMACATAEGKWTNHCLLFGLLIH